MNRFHYKDNFSEEGGGTNLWLVECIMDAAASRKNNQYVYCSKERHILDAKQSSSPLLF